MAIHIVTSSSEMECLSQVLKAMKSSAAHVVAGTCFVLDMSHQALILRLWHQWVTQQRKGTLMLTGARVLHCGHSSFFLQPMHWRQSNQLGQLDLRSA